MQEQRVQDASIFFTPTDMEHGAGRRAGLTLVPKSRDGACDVMTNDADVTRSTSASPNKRVMQASDIPTACRFKLMFFK